MDESTRPDDVSRRPGSTGQDGRERAAQQRAAGEADREAPPQDRRDARPADEV